MIELQAPVLAEHGRRGALYSGKISEFMGLDSNEVKSICLAAELRDIGYLRLPPSILNRSGTLRDCEIESIRDHPVIGARILRSVPQLSELVPLVLHHHERWDGSGYPEEVCGDETPLGARIIAVADVYDALTSERPHRSAYSPVDAVEHLVNNTGLLYDPEVVQAFAAYWEQQRKGRQNEQLVELRERVSETTAVREGVTGSDTEEADLRHEATVH
jgi:HD-GYP domain-containing protein (c-di-GMP phosphodiesterase class II)